MIVGGIFDALALLDGLTASSTAADVEPALVALDRFVVAGAPGGDEPRRAALELTTRLREGAETWGLQRRDLAYLALQQAGLHQRLGKPETACAVLERALLEPDNPAEEGFELAFLHATLMREREIYDQAETSLQTAEAYLEEIHEGTSRAYFLVRLLGERAQLLGSVGLHEEAFAVLEEEVAVARTATDDPLPLHLAIRNTLWVYMSANRHDRALVQLRGFEDANELPPEGSPLRTFLKLYEAICLIDCRFKDRLPEGTEDRDPVRLLHEILESGQLDRAERWKALESLVEAHLLENRLVEAERSLTELRAAPADEDRGTESAILRLEIRIALALTSAPKELPGDLLVRTRDAWAAFLGRWDSTRAVSEATAPLYHQERSNLAGSLVALHLAVEGAEGASAALDDLLLGQGVGSLARALEAPAVDTRTVQTSLLLPGEVAVLHQPAHEGGFVFLVTRESVRAFPLAPLHVFETRQKAFERTLDRALAGRDPQLWNAVDAAATTLYAEVFPPGCQESLDAHDRLAILSAEILGYVPFEMLRGPDGVALGLSHTIRYLPSAPAALALQRRRATRKDPPAGTTPDCVLFCADQPGKPEGLKFPGDLKVSTAAKEAFLDGYSPTNHTIVEGEAATPARLAEVCESGPRVLQILAHGMVDRARREAAGLLLAGSAPLVWPQQALALRAPPLVILAACETWSGPRRRGDDGGTHFTGSLLRAGADTVVASERPILLNWALEFFATVQKALANGADPAVALRRGRESLAGHEDPRWRHMGLLVHAIGLADRSVIGPSRNENAETPR